MRLRPYKPCDAAEILSWVKDEDTFRKWVTDRYPHYPITAEEMNEKYYRFNGDCTEPDNFYSMTAFDERGLVGHLILRFTDVEKTVLRSASSSWTMPAGAPAAAGRCSGWRCSMQPRS